MQDQTTTNLQAQRASLEAPCFELGFEGILTIPSLIITSQPNYKALKRQQGVW